VVRIAWLVQSCVLVLGSMAAGASSKTLIDRAGYVNSRHHYSSSDDTNFFPVNIHGGLCSRLALTNVSQQAHNATTLPYILRVEQGF